MVPEYRGTSVLRVGRSPEPDERTQSQSSKSHMLGGKRLPAPLSPTARNMADHLSRRKPEPSWRSALRPTIECYDRHQPEWISRS